MKEIKGKSNKWNCDKLKGFGKSMGTTERTGNLWDGRKSLRIMYSARNKNPAHIKNFKRSIGKNTQTKNER